MKGIILFLVAIFLTVILFPLGVAYELFKIFYIALSSLTQRIHQYFKALAISIDQLGNVALQALLNDTLITNSGYKFGNPDETISSVIGKNKLAGTLSPIGHKLDRVLDKFDNSKNHSINSIETDEN